MEVSTLKAIPSSSGPPSTGSKGEVVSDGPLAAAEMSMEVAQMLRDAGPWGQMFPEPLFDGRFRLLQQRLVGERHLKVMVEPVDGGPLLDGISRLTSFLPFSWPRSCL